MEHCDLNKTTEQALEAQYPTVSLTIIFICVPLVAAFGILCNSTFIIIVYREKELHTITNIFLVNLAIADFCFLTLTLAKSITSYTNSPVYDLASSFNTMFGCITPNLLIYLCYYASLWTITLVSIERYLAVCHPMWHRLVNDKWRAFRMVVATWLISILFASPTIPKWTIQAICIISSDGMEITEQIPGCSHSCISCKVILYSTDLLQFVIALIISITLYSLIVRSLTQSTGLHELQRNTTAHPMRNTVARMLIVNTTVFFICLTPFTIINIGNIGYVMEWFKWHDSTHVSLGWVARVLSLLNSALNPLIYNATNPAYRSVFKKAFLSLGLSRCCHSEPFSSEIPQRKEKSYSIISQV